MRPNQIEDDEEADEELEIEEPSEEEIQARIKKSKGGVPFDTGFGRVMTGMGDETLKKIGLPEAVYDEIIEYRRMRNFGAQRRQLQLIGKKMRDMDPAAVREAIARATGESRAAVALQHRCEALRDRFLADDEAVKNFIDEHTDIDIRRLRELVRSARREREQAKPPKSARELYRLLYAYFDEPLDLMMAEEIEIEEN